MKKVNILFLLIIIVFLFFPLVLHNNLKFYTPHSTVINFDNENTRLSEISGLIHIINNSGWVDFRNADNCTGQGTYSDPYVIEDLVIDGGISEHCIWIENSDVYFKIENCSVGHSSIVHTGIQLENTTHGLLINNNCTSNHVGIGLYLSDNNTISGNTLNNNDHGIVLVSSNNTISANIANNNNYNGISISGFGNNTVSGNVMNNNSMYGIYLSFSDENHIIENTANDNQYGIFLEVSNYNTISGNILLGNEECIVEQGYQGNIFKNNKCTTGNKEILGYNLYILLGIAACISVFISKKVKNKS